jgi:tetratricopeptide (TPR) repeat protein
VNAIGNVTYGLPALVFNIRVIPEVFYKIFIPVNISVLPTFSNTRTIIGSGIFLLILLLPFLIRDIDKKRYYFGLFWFFLFLLPGLLVMYSNQSEGFDYLDTRNYIPMMGLIISAGVILSLIKIKKYNFKELSFGFAILILLSVLTSIQSDNYRNAEVFAKNALESNPERPFFYQKLADYYFSNKDYKKAIGYLKEIIQREPDSFFYYKNLALAYMRLNQSTNALQVLEKAAMLNDQDHDVINAIIKISYELGRYKESLYYLNKAIESGGKVDPGFYESLKKLVSEQNEK